MSKLDLLALDSALLAEDDCGPDLDIEGDNDHLGFLARAEGILPPSFAEFDRSTVEFKAEIEAAGDLLARARDLRVLVLLAKILILDRRLPEFAGAMAGIAALVRERWESVHPTGDMEFRRGVLMALDDMPHVIMPLQSQPLFESRSAGRVSYRTWLIAQGTVQPRESESTFQASAVQAALEKSEDSELIEGRAAISRVQDSIRAISEAFKHALGVGHELHLPNLVKITGEIGAWLDGELRRRNPDLVPAASGGDDSAGDGMASTEALPIANHAEAKMAIDRIAGYFLRNEPSSPVLLLLRQCRQLADVSFVDALRILMPDAFPAAKIRVGRTSGFNLPVERLGEIQVDWSNEEITSAVEDAPTEPEWFSDGGSVSESESSSDTSAESEEGEGATIGDHSVIAEEAHSSAPAEIFQPSSVRPRTETKSERTQITTQRDALALISEVANFYRVREPSSPLPLLLERAASLVGRDFLAALDEMLPASHLRIEQD